MRIKICSALFWISGAYIVEPLAFNTEIFWEKKFRWQGVGKGESEGRPGKGVEGVSGGRVEGWRRVLSQCKGHYSWPMCVYGVVNLHIFLL